MEPKKKRYWLRGGIAAVLLIVVVFVILFLLGTPEYLCKNKGLCSGVPHWFYSLIPGALVANYLFNTIFPENAVMVFMVSIIFYFCAGALLGWLYGKIKNRKSVIN